MAAIITVRCSLCDAERKRLGLVTDILCVALTVASLSPRLSVAATATATVTPALTLTLIPSRAPSQPQA